MSIKKKGRDPIYPDSLKVAIAREYFTSNLGAMRLAQKHNLSTDTVNHFIKWYKKHYPQGEVVVESAAQPGQDRGAADLAKQLKEANLKIAALEMLIATAQKELGIDIVKKPGTKQSSR
jgi:transposase-like protein